MYDGFIKVAAATPKIRVADCVYNSQQIHSAIQSAAKRGVKVLVLPELCLTGYTCSDLFLQNTLISAAASSLKEIASSVGDILVFVGLPVLYGGKLYSATAALFEGKILGIVPKTYIPNYSEFYEKRHFSSAPEENATIDICGVSVPFGTKLIFASSRCPDLKIAAEICEDLWSVSPPSCDHAVAGATIIVNPSASDEVVGKTFYRQQLVSGQSGRLICGYIYADAGEGESTTDLVFTAHNMICENGTILNQSKFTDELLISEIDVSRLAFERRRITTFPDENSKGYTKIFFDSHCEYTALTRDIPCAPFVPGNAALRHERCEEILSLQALGLKKRLVHTNAKSAVIGISGGLDSTLALLVCARAFKALSRPMSDIITVTMPCFGTTQRTRSNAQRLCVCIGTEFLTIDITDSVKQHFSDIGQNEEKQDITFENSQARERTQVLMDIANKNSGLVIGTGDLSELALGWATYNGDHMSMYGVNASIPKTLVRYLVAHEAEISENEIFSKTLYDILDTPVSPELLRPSNGEISQKTEELVGPYELHDFFLYYAIRWGFEPKKIYRIARYAFAGKYDDTFILKWLKNFYRRFFAQQFKRSCLPDGPKVGSLTLSPRGDWRMPSDAVASLWLNELEKL